MLPSKIYSFIYSIILALCQISENIPYGILCFVPSYNAMEKLIERWHVSIHDYFIYLLACLKNDKNIYVLTATICIFVLDNGCVRSVGIKEIYSLW